MASETVGPVPSNAPEHCPGTQSEKAGVAEACQGCPNQQACASAPQGPDPDIAAIERRMRSVKHKILVLSGKGGVGKSTFAAQLAFALAERSKEVGLLDIDICGPSLPRMLGLEGEEVHQSGAGWSPVYVADGLGVMSIGFMLPGRDDPVIWRGPRKNSLIKQFLKDVDWGEIDYLVVDAPPGTSDEHISIAQYLRASSVDGAVVVTTPQEVSLIDVRKELNFCKKVGIPVLGVVENMSGLRLPASGFRFTAPTGAGGAREDISGAVAGLMEQHFGKGVLAEIDVFPSTDGGAAGMAAEAGVPFLGRVPLDPALAAAAEAGRAAAAEDSPARPALEAIVARLLTACQGPNNAARGAQNGAEAKGPVPAANGKQGSAAEAGLAMDPLLGSRIHLGF